MNSKMVLGQYYNTSSWLHRLDPRTKFISLFILMISVFLISDIRILASIIILVFLLIVSSKIPFIKFLQSFRMIAMLLVFTLFFQVMFNQTGDALTQFDFSLTWLNLGVIVLLIVLYILLGKVVQKFRVITFLLVVVFGFYLQTVFVTDPMITQYSIVIYEGGLQTALKVLLRIINLISLSSLLTLTTKPTDLNNGLESFFKPFRRFEMMTIIPMMIAIALRFIPTLMNEANRILKAQASRGVDFKEGKLHNKIIQIISLLIPMFVIARKRADDLADAMDARGYIPGAERSKINELKYRRADIITIVTSLGILTVLIVGKVFYAI